MEIEKLNGYLMSGDTQVLKVENGQVKSILNKTLMPLFFKKSLDIEKWLKERSIDEHRTNSRMLKKVLRLTETDDLSTVLHFNAATITDNFWFKEEDGKKLLYAIDIKFKFNNFSNLALSGNFDEFNKEPSRTPELTNIGSFEKCWKMEDGKWWLYKTGNKNEIFSEFFVYKLGTFLGFNMARYEYCEPYIKSLNFTNDNINFEPISNIIQTEDYEENYLLLKEYGKNLANDYLKMIYLDSLIFNVDRHTKNYGILRNNKTGEIIDLAPNFDNNISLIARGYPSDLTRKKDGLLSFLYEFLGNDKIALKNFINLNIPLLNKEDLTSIIKSIPIKVEEDKVISFILNGQKEISSFINKNSESLEEKGMEEDIDEL